MTKPSFFARRTFGAPNYFLIALAMTFVLALIPRGARKAIESNTNNVRDWLPRSYPESADLRWFQHHFLGEQFAVVTYDGCTLGAHEKLTLLAKKLVPADRAVIEDGIVDQPEAESVADKSKPQETSLHPVHRWFTRASTGPGMIEKLSEQFTRIEAIERLEGAFVGPRKKDANGKLLPQESRTTCLVVTLSKEAVANNKNMRAAIETIDDVAVNQCAIPRETVRMGGPPVDNVTIDIEGEKTLMRLALLSGLAGLILSYWCFRSFKLMGIVFAVGVVAAAMSLAVVFYFGVYESLALGRVRFGTVDAILMSMPPVVYVLGISGAIHIINYYKDARREIGLDGAAEQAVSHGWGPCTLAALTTAVGLASLYASDITPIKKFGTFTAVAVVGTLGVLFTLLPIALYRFPLNDREVSVGERHSGGGGFSIAGVLDRIGGFVVRHNMAVCCFWVVVMALFAYGFTRIDTQVQLLKLFDEDADIIHDYAWLEKNLGNLVPMEVVIAIDEEQTRASELKESDDDGIPSAESNGKRYRMTRVERVHLIRKIQKRIEEKLPQVGMAMAVPTFVPEVSVTDTDATTVGKRNAIEGNLDKDRNQLREHLAKEEITANQLNGNVEEDATTGRELWRISARVQALGGENEATIDYGKFVKELKHAVEPVLIAYRQRDDLLTQLHEQGVTLAESKLIVLYRKPPESDDAKAGQKFPKDSQEFLLSELLQESQAIVTSFNLANLSGLNLDDEQDQQKYARLQSQLKKFTTAVIVSAGRDKAAHDLTAGIIPLVDVSKDVVPPGSPAKWDVNSDEPLPIGAVYTGVVPLVYKTQNELLVSLKDSIAWATVLIAIVMIFVLRSPAAGLFSMVPNVFPIVIVFGALGWLGIKIDIGTMMTASVALGVAVDDTVHFVWWFQHGIRERMGRHQAVMYAYDRCGTAMTQTTVIAGLGLAVFGASTFTPTQQFGFLMITMLSAALIGDLLLLPAILAGPVGIVFAKRMARLAEKEEKGQADPPEGAVDSKNSKPRIYAPHSRKHRHDSTQKSA